MTPPDETQGLAPEGAPPAPEPTGPDWTAFEKAGITPDKADEVRQAYDLYRGLQNLDTRGQYLQQIVRPGIDDQTIQSLYGDQTEEQDPWAGVFGEEEEPPEPQFDPRALPGVFEQYEQRILERAEQTIMGKLTQMAQVQEFESSAQAAVQAHGLPQSDAMWLRGQVEQMARQYPNRQPREIANEIAQARKTELLQWLGQAQAPPAPASGPTGGPVPAPTQPPQPGEDPGSYGLS